MIGGWYQFVDHEGVQAQSIWNDSTQVRGTFFNGPKIMSYEILEEYSHDPSAFTQGLIVDDYCPLGPSKPCKQVFIESTGMYGRSSVRRVDIKSGEVLKRTDVHSSFFAEGLVELNGKYYQLTWKRPTGFIYDENLQKIGVFETPLKDGWGLTTDGAYLVASDSSNMIYWIDPNTYRIARQVAVNDDGHPVKWINEMEWIEDEIWANVWQTDCIARIDPQSGRVNSWMYLGSLSDAARRKGRQQGVRVDVLNGIAWDGKNRNLYLTGKLWPSIYRVRAVNANQPPSEADLLSIRQRCIPA